MARRRLGTTIVLGLAALVLTAPTRAADALKIGLVLPMTGPFASYGKQIAWPPTSPRERCLEARYATWE